MDFFSNLYQTSCASLSTFDIVKRIFVVIIAWVVQSMMLLCMNFMLASFEDSRKSSYTTLLTMALLFLVFAIAFFLTMLFLAYRVNYFESGKLAFKNLLNQNHIIQVALLGLFDALGGVTGTYAAPNTPVAMQMTLLATSVAWTFLFAKWLVPDRQRPCTPLVFFSTTMTFVGAAVTIIPQWNSMENMRGIASTIAWIFVFLLAALFPLFLNILYARYLVITVDGKGRSIIVVDGGEVTNDNTFALDDEDGDQKDEDNNHQNQQRNTNHVPSAIVDHGEEYYVEKVEHVFPPHNNNHGRHDYNNNTNNHGENAQNSDSGNSNNDNKIIDPSIMSPTSRKEVTVIAAHNWSYFMCKLSIAVLGDAIFQTLFIVMFFPLDFMPWFGAAENAAESWAWLKHGFDQVFTGANPSVSLYFVLYTIGFFFSHLLGAGLSYYSPQLTAFIFSVNTPLNLLYLAIFPSWNVFGEQAPAWASIASIILTAVGALTYAAWEHNQRIEQRKLKKQIETGEESSSNNNNNKSGIYPVDEEEAKQNASAATLSFQNQQHQSPSQNNDEKAAHHLKASRNHNDDDIN